MGSRLWLQAAVAVVCLIFCGCDDAANDSAAKGTEPAIGTCWAVPDKDMIDPDYWFDESPQVPCSESHTTETAAVLQLSEPTIAEAMKELGNCWNEVRVYLGIDLRSWFHCTYWGALPSQ